VGVDVFFVISGFLITRSLLGDAAPGRFRRFYARRVIRLAPALVVVLASTLVLGYGTLTAGAFHQLTSHVRSAALFIANIAFWRESGYFDAAAIEKPLLHLWSLGIEEQFYLVWPLGLYWLVRRAGRALPATTLIAALSFLACVVMVKTAPEAAFYLPWFRIWEPLAGAALALWFRRNSEVRIRRPDVLAWTGLLLILWTALSFEHGALFPSWSALGPVLGSAMLIASGDRSWLGRTLFSWSPVVGLGRISYPLYLWHWPLISLLGDANATGGVASRIRLTLIATALSAATYLWIEKPSKRLNGRWPRATITTLCTAMVLLVVFSSTVSAPVVHSNPNLEVVEEAMFLDAELRAAIPVRVCESEAPLRVIDPSSCYVSGPQPPVGTILLWGDSTADSWAPLVHHLAAERGQTAVVLSMSGCPPLLGVRGPLHEGCDLEDDSWKVGFIEELQPTQIIVSARWAAYVNEILSLGRVDTHFVTQEADGQPDRETSRQAVAQTLAPTLDWLLGLAPVVVIESPPDLLAEVKRALPLNQEYRPTLAAHQENQQLISRLFAETQPGRPQLAFLDPAEKLCATGRCVAILDEKVVYLDDHHVTAQGALLFRDELVAALDEAQSAPDR
jgi:peptidoglycan/LPS O-acetylase OafA/YrhL